MQNLTRFNGRKQSSREERAAILRRCEQERTQLFTCHAVSTTRLAAGMLDDLRGEMAETELSGEHVQLLKQHLGHAERVLLELVVVASRIRNEVWPQ